MGESLCFPNSCGKSPTNAADAATFAVVNNLDVAAKITVADSFLELCGYVTHFLPVNRLNFLKDLSVLTFSLDYSPYFSLLCGLWFCSPELDDETS